MTLQRKMFALNLAALVALLIGIQQRAGAYEYVRTDDKSEYMDWTPEDETDTHWLDGMASADANDCCSSSTHAYADANNGDSASAEGVAAAYRSTDWDWDGPPGTAPGGHLSWSLDSSGYASVSGSTPQNYGSGASSSASAGSSTASSSSGSSSNGYGHASGSVTNWNTGTGTAEYGGSPQPYLHFPTTDHQAGFYHYAMEWASYGSGNVNIPSGTAHMYFSGSSGCVSYADATAASSERAGAYSYASALGRPEGSFSSN